MSQIVRSCFGDIEKLSWDVSECFCPDKGKKVDVCFCSCTPLRTLFAFLATIHSSAPFLRARGTDGRFARHVQSPIYVDSRVTQGLDAPPRTSTSHLATDHGSRPPAAQSRSELSLATRAGPRTMEATHGNGYAPVRGMPAMMMIHSFPRTFKQFCSFKALLFIVL